MNIIKFLSPTNLAEEKEKFFSSATYNPSFTYSWNTEDGQRWIENQIQYKPLVLALQGQDFEGIVREAKKVFHTDLQSDFLFLAREITQRSPEKFPKIPLDEIVTAFTNAFEFLGLPEYSVEVVDQHGFNFRPSPQEKKIVMSKHLNLDFFSVDGEVKHELVHIIRYENGKYNDIPLAPDYLPTEEGLATFCQDYAGEDGATSLFQHAAEYTMTEVALKGSLRDVTEYLQEIGFSAELAWQRGVRHKFGWIDTAQPGDIMKPSMYFYHQQLIRQLSDEERYRLFIGKITRDQLGDFPTYLGKIPLNILYQFYKWDESIRISK